MLKKKEENGAIWHRFLGMNQGYMEEQYMLYLKNPNHVDQEMKKLFEIHGKPAWLHKEVEQQNQLLGQINSDIIPKITKAMQLFDAIRRYGHLEADIYPIGEDKDRTTPLVKLSAYDLTEKDLLHIDVNWLTGTYPIYITNGLELFYYLLKKYTGTISYEFDHVNNHLERKWLIERIECSSRWKQLTNIEERHLLCRIIEVEGFEAFLQKTFVGQKRFSLEGLEMMIPMLDLIVEQANEDRVEHMMMGMAHRGRLSVLAHILGKPIDQIFSEFHKAPDRELIPSDGPVSMNDGWSGDVKYHFGAQIEVTEGNETMRITLAHNPSHLEYVNPVVQGFTRAAQDDRRQQGYPKQRMNETISVIIHGDAAFIGEGIVAETLNLSGLPGYQTGGTLHIIANNLLGYTTNGREGRSTRYASDLAKGFEIPVIHVNADDPISCLSAIEMAYEYRKKFNKDVVIDLVGYRRYGHNEMDEPRTTQPLLYQEIDRHPSVAHIYAKKLLEQNLIEEDFIEEKYSERAHELRAIYDSMQEEDEPELEMGPLPKALTEEIGKFETSVALEKLKRLNERIYDRPDGFSTHPKLEKILQRRKQAFINNTSLDWGTVEALLYASIIHDGTPIRLTGQDTERGTFAHRHLVLHDVNDGHTFCPLHRLTNTNVSFEIRNSPLSEAAVLGFEYGYSVQSPESLVIWEAQFGDFANVAQVIFDQFITSSRAKWGEKSNMVILLPHGYEGQGPEHSSARPERYLQLVAENNLIVANVTSTAQYFHLMRRQAALCNKEAARPLILMTPKSLLRSDYISSKVEDLTKGTFMLLKEQTKLNDRENEITRLVIGSGKIMVDIEKQMENLESNLSWLHIVRLEQIYPFPEEELTTLIHQLPNLQEIVWVQEEPRNMGAWTFVRDYLRKCKQEKQLLRYLGRPKRASPAVGEPNIHQTGQNHIIEAAISPEIRSVFL